MKHTRNKLVLLATLLAGLASFAPEATDTEGPSGAAADLSLAATEAGSCAAELTPRGRLKEASAERGQSMLDLENSIIADLLRVAKKDKSEFYALVYGAAERVDAQIMSILEARMRAVKCPEDKQTIDQIGGIRSLSSAFQSILLWVTDQITANNIESETTKFQHESDLYKGYTVQFRPFNPQNMVDLTTASSNMTTLVNSLKPLSRKCMPNPSTMEGILATCVLMAFANQTKALQKLPQHRGDNYQKSFDSIVLPSSGRDELVLPNVLVGTLGGPGSFEKDVFGGLEKLLSAGNIYYHPTFGLTDLDLKNILNDLSLSQSTKVQQAFEDYKKSIRDAKEALERVSNLPSEVHEEVNSFNKKPASTESEQSAASSAASASASATA